MKKNFTLLVSLILVFFIYSSNAKAESQKENKTTSKSTRVSLEESKRLYFAVALSYQWKSDKYYQLVYDKGVLNYLTDAGYWFSNNFASGIKVSYLTNRGETSLLKKETKLRQISVMVYIKAAIGRKLKSYFSLGAGYLFFKEESYIATVDESHIGWEGEIGFEFSLTESLYLMGSLRNQSFRKSFPELGETQQLGGKDLRIGIGFRF